MSYRSEFWETVAVIMKKDYVVDWEPKNRDHWAGNPFDLK